MSLAVLDMASWRQRLHGSRLLIVLELTLVAAVLVANHRMYLGTEPYLLVLGWGSLALRGVRWGDLGFRFGPRWPFHLLAGVIAGVSIEAVQLLAAHSGLLDLHQGRRIHRDRRPLGLWQVHAAAHGGGPGGNLRR